MAERSRRAFLKLLGVAAAAIPLAATVGRSEGEQQTTAPSGYSVAPNPDTGEMQVQALSSLSPAPPMTEEQVQTALRLATPSFGYADDELRREARKTAEWRVILPLDAGSGSTVWGEPDA